MANNKGLGKGFAALIPTDLDTTLLIDTGERIHNLSINVVVPNPEQPRRLFEQTALEELANSIRQYGILQPLIVSPHKDDTYIIVAGERRWRAGQLAGLDTVPAIVRNQKELQQLEVALIENVQRVDLSPIEQAVSIERLHQQFNMSYKDIAKRLAKAETTVSNIVRLLQLPPIARDALQLGLISEGHARAILAVKDSSAQEELLNLIQKNDWSVRQAEQYASSLRQGVAEKEIKSQRVVSETAETRKLAKVLSTKVSVRRMAKGGRLEIHFKSDEELTKLIYKLGKLR